MSQETQLWLDTYTLHGYGRVPWHGKAGNDNIYPGAIPVEEINRRLFNWSATPLPVYVAIPATVETADGMTATGEPVRYVLLADRQAIAPNDKWEEFDGSQVFGIFTDGYKVHQYPEWLFATVEKFGLADHIGTAGLIRNRGIAWISFETPETFTKCGVEYYPRLLMGSSHNGTMPSSGRQVQGLTVCDNTFFGNMFGRQGGTTVRVKHTRNSKSSQMSEGLAQLLESAEDFGKELETLTNTPVTDAQWAQILEKLVPDKETKSGATRANTKREELDALYRFDSRVNPWKGTLFGVLQATNTWEQHKKPVKGSTVRYERNWLETLTGAGETEKRDTLALAQSVLAGV